MYTRSPFVGITQTCAHQLFILKKGRLKLHRINRKMLNVILYGTFSSAKDEITSAVFSIQYLRNTYKISITAVK